MVFFGNDLQFQSEVNIGLFVGFLRIDAESRSGSSIAYFKDRPLADLGVGRFVEGRQLDVVGIPNLQLRQIDFHRLGRQSSSSSGDGDRSTLGELLLIFGGSDEESLDIDVRAALLTLVDVLHIDQGNAELNGPTSLVGLESVGDENEVRLGGKAMARRVTHFHLHWR